MVVTPTPTPGAYLEFQEAFDYFNKYLFDNSLPPCFIALQRDQQSKGYFTPGRLIRHSGEVADEITLNPAYFAVLTSRQILAVLVHEMVHMWQFHHGRPGRGRYHNKEWANKMESIGLMPSDTGKPGGKRTGDCMNDYILPGSLFDAVCHNYEDSFDIASWCDRFPAYVSAPETPLEEQGGASEEEKTRIREEHEGLIRQRVKLEQMGVTFALSPKKASNRVKYRCPRCWCQVWGKPGLRVRCMDCEGEPQMVHVAD